MKAIQKGDSFVLPFKIRQGDTEIVPTNIAYLRFGIGQYSGYWPNGKITYQDERWLFPLTQQQTYSLKSGFVPVQAQVQLSGGQTFGSKVKEILCHESLLKGAFGNQQEADGKNGQEQNTEFFFSDQYVDLTIDLILENVEITTQGGGIPWELGHTMKLVNNVLDVNTADEVQQDNTLPITSAAVYTEVGNINALLATI